MDDKDDNPTKKIKFSPSNVEMYEAEFLRIHDIAMGYIQRPVPLATPTKSIQEQLMERFPCPSPLRDNFQALIAIHKQAVFDCFLPPAWLCSCYKCETWRGTQDEHIDFYENIMDLEGKTDNINQAALSVDDTKVSSAPFHSDIVESLAGISLTSVSHYCMEIPPHGQLECVTPAFSAPTYILYSDQGKAEAQRKWIARMRMTPTRLIF